MDVLTTENRFDSKISLLQSEYPILIGNFSNAFEVSNDSIRLIRAGWSNSSYPEGCNEQVVWLN